MYKSVLLALVVLRQFVKAKKIITFNYQQVDEIARNAIAYGWEIGAGVPLKSMVDASPNNPFLTTDWRKDVV